MSLFATIAIVLGILWALGLFAVHISTPLIHVILIVALVLFVYDVAKGRRG
jgi:hypothetical protein